MAYSTFLFNEFSNAQLQVVTEQRDKTGFHAYYQNGFDDRAYTCICPWFMRNGCIFTSVFYFPSQKGTGLRTNSELALGRFNDHFRDKIKVSFDQIKAMYLQYIRANSALDTVPLGTRNVRGFHVLQFVRENDDMQVYFDGEHKPFTQTKPTGSEIEEFVVYYTQDSDPRFVMVESHYTMTDTTLIRTAPAFFNTATNYFFYHQHVFVSVGGYALWNGVWKPNTRVSARDNYGGHLAEEVQVPNTGTMVAVIKFYATGCAFYDANDTSKMPIISGTRTRAELNNLFIKPDPESIVEFKFETGEISY